MLTIELAVIAGVVLLYVIAEVLGRISHFILLLVAAIAIALIVSPTVGRLERAIGNRLAAAAIVYVGVLVVVGVGLALIAAPLIREARDFASALPSIADRSSGLAAGLQGALANWGISLDLSELAARASSQVQAGGAAILGGTIGVAASVTSTLADVVVALVLSFYLSIDGPRLRDQAHARVPAAYAPKMWRLEASARRVFGGYVRGQMILALFIGVLAGVGSAFIGLPYPVVLGVLAGVFELVPMFGSLLGAIPAVVVALFQPFPTVLWVVIFFVAVNQVENYVLAPRVTGQSLGLSPLYTLLALLLGVEVAGFLGALLAVPVAALIMDLLRPEESVTESSAQATAPGGDDASAAIPTAGE